MSITPPSSAAIIQLRPDINVSQEQPTQAEPKRQFPWFRLYNEVLNDPKVQRLDGETFKGWINILCLAQKHDWTLPNVVDVAFALRMTEEAASVLIHSLHRLNLLDEVADATFMPHNWKGRQYRSDADPTAPARSKRYRDRKSNALRNDPITRYGNDQHHAPVTRDETRDATDQIQIQTQTQNRTEADKDKEQTQRQNITQQAVDLVNGIMCVRKNAANGVCKEESKKAENKQAENKQSGWRWTPELSPEEFWSEVRGAAEAEGQPIGWAAHRYKDKYGKSPDRAWNAQPASKPSRTTLNWIEERQAAYTNGQGSKSDDTDIPF